MTNHDVSRLQGPAAALRLIAESAVDHVPQSAKHLLETVAYQKAEFLRLKESSVPVRALMEANDGFEEAFVEVIDELTERLEGRYAT